MFDSKQFVAKHFDLAHFIKSGTGVNVFNIGNRTAHDELMESSLAITDNLNARNTCNFMLKQTARKRHLVGQVVEVRTAVCPGEVQKTIFKGSIDRIAERNEFIGAQLFFSVEAVDFNQLADKRLVTKIYENITVKAMILDIVDVFMKDDNVTTNGVETLDTVIEKAVFSYVTVAKAFDDISKLTGFHWNIDYDKDLKFFKRSTGHSGFTIDGNTAVLNKFCDWLEEFKTRKVQGIKFANFNITRQREQLTNEQFVIAGKDTTTLRQDEFVGNGKDRQFTLRYELAELKLNLDGTIADDAISLSPGGNESVGLRDRDEGEVKWLTQKGEKEIIQDEAETPIPDTTTLTVKYKGLRPIIIKSSSGPSKKERKNIEQGSSGIYSRVHDDESIEKESYAIDYANGLIRRYKDIPVIVTTANPTGQQISSSSLHVICGVSSENSSLISRGSSSG